MPQAQQGNAVVGVLGSEAESVVHILCGGRKHATRSHAFSKHNLDGVAQPLCGTVAPDGTLYLHCDPSPSSHSAFSELQRLRASLLLLTSVHVALIINAPRTLDADLLRTLRVLAEAKRALLPGLPASTPPNAPGRCIPVAVFSVGPVQHDFSSASLTSPSELERALSERLEWLLLSAYVTDTSLSRPLLATSTSVPCVATRESTLRAALTGAADVAASREYLPSRKQFELHIDALATHLTTAASCSDNAQQPSRGWSPMERAMHRLASALKPEEDASRKRCKYALSAARSGAAATAAGDDETAVHNANNAFYARAGGVLAEKYERTLQEELQSLGSARCQALSLSGRQCIHGPHELAEKAMSVDGNHDSRASTDDEPENTGPRRLWSERDEQLQSACGDIGTSRSRRSGARHHSTGAFLRRACACGGRIVDQEEPFSISSACRLPACDEQCACAMPMSIECVADPEDGEEDDGYTWPLSWEKRPRGDSSDERASTSEAGACFVYVPVGAASVYDTSHGLYQTGFRRGLNKLAAMRPPVPVCSDADSRVQLHSPSRSKKKAKPKLSVGFEYESPRGERFIARPEHIGKDLPEEESKHAGDALLAVDMPLFLPCPSAMPEPAQLARVFVITPPSSYGTLMSRPEICVPMWGRQSDVTFMPSAEVQLPSDSLVSIALPLAYPAHPKRRESGALLAPGIVRDKAVLLAHTAVYSAMK